MNNNQPITENAQSEFWTSGLQHTILFTVEFVGALGQTILYLVYLLKIKF